MQPLDTVNLWTERVRDRARMRSFAGFLWHRFLDDRLFQAAASLAYTTIFALVPLAMVVFGVLSAFPVFNEWSDRLSDYIFSNFVPAAARSVEAYLRQFSASAGQLTSAGTIALMVSLLITLNSVEQTFNRIWRVVSARPRLTRFLVYWTVLTLGALLAAASLAASAQFFALPLFKTSEGRLLAQLVLSLAPVLIEFVCIVLVYRVVPHHTVKLRHAVPGALLAVALLELVKWGLSLYLGSFQSYQRIYGTVAFVPIFLLWIYLSWIGILLGASLASSIAAFRYQPASMRLPAGYEIYGLLRLLGRFAQARKEGRGLHEDQILQLEPMLTDSLVQELLCELERIRLLSRVEHGEWLLARDLADVPLTELYENCQLRIPIDETYLPCRDDALGQAACRALDELRLPLRDVLKRRVGDLYTALGDSA
ncbi:YihY family inner membrane protein [Xanthomonas medicagonis]|uniref:YihY family inner membrane protein n=1 Tax=Xanthomonas medicagonis TaxID=3160841 RepID=UPI00351945B6